MGMRHGTPLACLLLLSSLASAAGAPVVRTRVGTGSGVGTVPQIGVVAGGGMVQPLGLSGGLQATLNPSVNAAALSAPNLAPSVKALPAANEAPAPIPTSRALVPLGARAVVTADQAASFRAAANDAAKPEGAAASEGEQSRALVPVDGSRNLPAIREVGALVPVEGQSAAEAAANERRLALTFDGGKERAGHDEAGVAGSRSGPLLLEHHVDAPPTEAAPVPPAPPSTPKESPFKRAWNALPKATVALIAANVIAYAVVGAPSIDALFAHGFDSDLARGAFMGLNPGGMASAVGRAFTASFMHSDPMTLAVNMAVLALLGALVERRLGSKAVLGVYAGGILVSGALVTLLAPHTLGFGSAGAILGLLPVFLLNKAMWGRLAAAARDPRRLFSGADGWKTTAATLGLGAAALAALSLALFDASWLFGVAPGLDKGYIMGHLGGMLGGGLLMLGAGVKARLSARRASSSGPTVPPL